MAHEQEGEERVGTPAGCGDPGLGAAVEAFEAANERPATRLERQLLGALAEEFEGAARARGSSGAAWVAAAIVEAVDSGSRYVAPKRVRAICRRWASEGLAHRSGSRAHAASPVGRLLPPGPLPPEGAGPLSRRGERAGDASALSLEDGEGEALAPRHRGPSGQGEDARQSASRSRQRKGRRAGPSRREASGGATPEVAPAGPEPEVSARAPERQEPPTFLLPGGPGLTNKQLWSAVLDELRPTCTAGSFATWLKPTRLIGLEEGALVVGVPNSFARGWLAERFASPIARAVAAILGESRPVRFEVADEWLALRRDEGNGNTDGHG